MASPRVGDVIAVNGNYGRIDTLSARYVSVITLDGIEHLIPNEDLITQRVENWSYSNELLRLHQPVGISYSSDVRKAMQLCLEACADVPRVRKEPRPVCLLQGFGDSSVDLEIRFWISDPMNVPGTTGEYPNWRRKLPVGVAELFADADVARAQAVRHFARVAALGNVRVMKAAQVLEALRSGAGTPMEIVATVYAEVDPVLHPMAERSIRAHLDKLVAEGAVTVERRDGQEAFGV